MFLNKIKNTSTILKKRIRHVAEFKKTSTSKLKKTDKIKLNLPYGCVHTHTHSLLPCHRKKRQITQFCIIRRKTSAMELRVMRRGDPE